MTAPIKKSVPYDVQYVLEALYRYDYITYSHCIRVGVIAQKVAERLQLTMQQCLNARNAGFIHDYGKVFIPMEILCAPRSLSDSEMLIVKSHVITGVTKLKELNFDSFNSETLTAVQQHHENVDGSGYPKGIKDISLLGRILRVVDGFDALTHNRIYKKAFSLEDSFGILKVYNDKYDKKVVTCLEKIVQKNEFTVTDLCLDYVQLCHSNICEYKQ